MLAAALDCFTDQGYDQTSVALIRQRSGVSNGALFHHFPNKEAIADALYLEAMVSVQTDYWAALHKKPSSLREAVAGIVGHQLAWVERHPQWAKFLYSRDHLDWAGEAGAKLQSNNKDLAAAYREWLSPFVATGAARELSTPVIVAIVTGPAHAIARRWLAGHLHKSLTDYADDLIDAAVAGLTGKPPRTRRPKRTPTRTRIRWELVDDEGEVLYTGEHDAELNYVSD